MAKLVSGVQREDRRPFGLFRRPWFILIFVVTLLIIFAATCERRFQINSDGISYLDMSRQLLQGQTSPLFHPYWSPLYPLLLALGIKVVPSCSDCEILSAHAVNSLVGAAALLCFCFFLQEWLHIREYSDKELTDSALFFSLALAFTLFLTGAIGLIGLGLLTPDVVVFALAFLIAALGMRLENRRGGRLNAAVLGVVLGMAYLAKAVMFPLGVLLLVLLALSNPRTKKRLSLVALATLTFIVITVPYITILSLRAHRLTFGEAGRLNYAWAVQQQVPPHAGWVQASRNSGTPVHPLRVLMTHPTVFEFRDTVPGTSPVWFDPSYFYQGLQISFSLRTYIRTLPEALLSLYSASGGKVVCLPVLVGFLVLLVLGRRAANLRIPATWLLLWSFAAFATYSIVTIESRYIAPWVVIVLFASLDLVGALIPPEILYLRNWVFLLITIIGFCALSLSMLYPAAYLDSRDQIVVARELSREGLQPGDLIAIVGDPFNVYYAHLDGLQIVSTIGWKQGQEMAGQEYATFWTLSDTDSEALKQKLRKLGVRAIVSSQSCPPSSKGCRSISNTHYSVLLIVNCSDHLGRFKGDWN